MLHNIIFSPFTACLAMNKQCHCEVQGASACAAVSNTECNVDTGACECPPIYIEQSGQCFKVHASDGSAIAPFKHGNGNIKWKPTAATSASPDNGAFGIPANDFYLLADGSVSVAQYLHLIFEN